MAYDGYGMPRVDFSILGNLGKDYKNARKEATRERTLAELGQGASIEDVGRKLFQSGDIEGGLSLAKLADAQAQRDWTRTYQSGMLDIARQQLARRDEPEDIRKIRAAGMDPNSPEGRKALFPRTDTPISATDKKAIFEAEDAVPQLQGTVENLSRAIELNDKTFSGYTAGLRGDIGTKLPGGGFVVDENAALATAEWSKIMGPEALNQMASTLKGATTDFELRKFIEMLGDPGTPPQVRKGVIQRMKLLAERKLQVQGARVKDLREGSYFKPNGPKANKPITRDEFEALPSGSQFMAPDGTMRVKP